MKVLFVCNQNQNRSKTAEHIFRGRFKTKSAGLYNRTPLTEKQISWALALLTISTTVASVVSLLSYFKVFLPFQFHS